ncbi:ATP-binding protein [Streptomyces sp. AM 2-1-1]|uniref:ATP-binding protein n=1 Tax=Streptomyces sp. AM 2-1-1 TaxID=3028709 RepID=UPI0023B8EA0D|nr:ATP-binding protein [Streptomyces sp. AM 2-1-1]WEH42731.1 ATP-binding protein [Streptomyces sp. AM 2-1-1]
MPKNPPASMQDHLRRRLNRHARARWPHVDSITVHFRAGFAYVAAELPGGKSLPLCRLRFTGVPHDWGFALYLAGNGSYRDGILPHGLPAGAPEEALDRAGDLYLSVLPSAVRVPTGLVVLVGPPASGKTSFVRALVARRQIDAEAVVSSDEIRTELFGTSPAEATSDAADARIFQERDRRIVARLAAGQSAIAESTNVTPQARARLIALAARFHAPVTMLRFDPDVTDLLRQYTERGRTDLTATDVRAYAALMTRDASADRLRSEGATDVHDVPGRRRATTPEEAAAHFSFA